jgi:hypothetical protein
MKYKTTVDKHAHDIWLSGKKQVIGQYIEFNTIFIKILKHREMYKVIYTKILTEITLWDRLREWSKTHFYFM